VPDVSRNQKAWGGTGSPISLSGATHSRDQLEVKVCNNGDVYKWVPR